MTKCKAKTSAGSPCKLDAGPSGYCHVHDPECIRKRAAERDAAKKTEQSHQAKGVGLRQAVDAIIDGCRARGWSCSVSHMDSVTWLYATLHARRNVRGMITQEEEALIELTMDKTFAFTVRPISIESHGVPALQEAIVSRLEQLPWVGKLTTAEERAKAPSVAPAPTPSDNVRRLVRRFHVVARELERRHAGRAPFVLNDEYDVQDLLRALLRTHFDDVRTEDPAPSRAGASSRTDFLVKEPGIVVETKMAGPKLRDKQIGEQLIVDIERYKAHPDCKELVCLVYDPKKHLDNPAELENDLSRRHDGLSVFVIVIPR
ncbi:MAG: hypothetical protein ABIE42_08630 [Candidatus Eisenbacteria bacterium]